MNTTDPLIETEDEEGEVSPAARCCGGGHAPEGPGFGASHIPWTGPQMGNVWVTHPDRRRKRGPAARPVLLTLLTRRELTFDARANQIESLPLPTFSTAAYGTWVLSVAVSVKTGYLAANQLKIWIQNVVTDGDNPAVVFAGDGPSVTIASSPAAPHLATSSTTSAVGPEARLLMQWTQGANAFSPPGSPVAKTVISAWLTLRPKSKPPVT